MPIIVTPLTLTSSVARRDRLVVRTLRCGRSNPGSNPGLGILIFYRFLFKRNKNCNEIIIIQKIQGSLSCFEKEPRLRLITWLPKPGRQKYGRGRRVNNCCHDKSYSGRSPRGACHLVRPGVFENVNNTRK